VPVAKKKYIARFYVSVHYVVTFVHVAEHFQQHVKRWAELVGGKRGEGVFGAVNVVQIRGREGKVLEDLPFVVLTCVFQN